VLEQLREQVSWRQVRLERSALAPAVPDHGRSI
jgi:hypothetical protein